MSLSFVVAMAQNRVIGRNNRLPWHLPADLRHFKKITLGKPMLMGRKTYESIGRPLPGRTNIVISRDPGYAAPGCIVVHSIPEAIAVAGPTEEAMVIGGASLFDQTLDRAERIYLTLVHADAQGDVRFPEIDLNEWREIRRENHPADEKNTLPYSFILLEKK